jgi:hypothetical protein
MLHSGTWNNLLDSRSTVPRSISTAFARIVRAGDDFLNITDNYSLIIMISKGGPKITSFAVNIKRKNKNISRKGVSNVQK